MPSLSAENIADLVSGTLSFKPRENRWTDLASRLTRYHFFSEMLRRNYVDIIENGHIIPFHAMTGDSGAARHVGLYEEDSTPVVDTLTSGQVPWRHTTTSWAIDRRELAMNSGNRQIVNMVLKKDVEADLSMADALEVAFWGKAGVSDNKTPWGVKNFLVKSATKGFNTTNPSGYSDVAGIDPTNVARWANYAAPYTNITVDDLIDEMREAYLEIDWRPPVNIPQYDKMGQEMCIYCGKTVWLELQKLGRFQNESNGNDLAYREGNITFMGHPIKYVPELDADTDQPVYMLDWSVFRICILRGENMNESSQLMQANSHTVFKRFKDLTHNVVCFNRRKCAVLSTAAANT